MKIGMLMYDIQDLGGIVSNTEWLVQGLKELGHTVDLIQLVWKTSVTSQHHAITSQHYKGNCGLMVSQQGGWIFPARNRIAYKGTWALDRARRRLSEYDLLVWTIATPSKAKDMRGNTDWLQLYDLPARTVQVAYLHDGNLEKLSAHFLHAEPYMRSVGCVHPCCYNAARAVLKKPSALLYSSQPRWPSLDDLPSWSSRAKGWLCCQVFKAWKHGHELVRAVPFMPREIEKHIGGSGIEQRYLASRDKCKERYYYDSNTPFQGRRYWEVALEYGLQWHGWMTPDQRDAVLRTVRCQVDPSWSRSYIDRGEHFNRVSVEALRMGSVPIAHPGAIDSGDSDCLFQPMVNYYPIPIFGADGEPIIAEEYANHIEAACNLHPRTADSIIREGRKLESHFLYLNVAQRCLDLMHPPMEINEHMDPVARVHFEEKADQIMALFRGEE